MELRHIAIEESKSLTAAAEKLFLTQPALSHQLKEFENKLGAQVFKRQNKKMIITDIGRKVIDSANIVLNEINKLEDEIRSIIHGRSGRVKLSTECYTTYHWLPEIIKSYNKENTNVEVDIIVEATSNPLAFLIKGEIDFALVNTINNNPLLLFIPITDDEIVLITEPAHELSVKNFVTAKSFAKETLITYNSPDEELFIFQKLLSPQKITPPKIIKVAFTEAIFGMVKAGLGVAAVNKWAAEPYINRGEIKSIKITRGGLKRKWYAAILHENKNKAIIKNLINYLKTSTSK